MSRAGAELTELAERTGVPVITTIMGKGAISDRSPAVYRQYRHARQRGVQYRRFRMRSALFGGHAFQRPHYGKDQRNLPRTPRSCISTSTRRPFRAISSWTCPSWRMRGKRFPNLLEILSRFAKNIEEWTKRLQKLRDEKPIVHDGAKSELTPTDAILQEINRCVQRFYRRDRRGAEPDVGDAVPRTSRGKAGLITSGGLGTMGFGLPAAIGAKLGCPDHARRVRFGRRRRADEHTGTRDGGLSGNSAHPLHTQQFLSRQRAAVAGNVLRRQVFLHLPAQGASSCPASGALRRMHECPPYIPDFVKLAESYGVVRGYACTRREDMLRRVRQGGKLQQTFAHRHRIHHRQGERTYLPMVPGGNALSEMVDRHVKRRADKWTIRCRKRWISLYVENDVGVLAKIVGLVFGQIVQSDQPHRRGDRGSKQSRA